MTAHFLKTLYLGKELTPEEHADIPHYRAELHYHVLYKTVQAGSILGMFVIGPLVGLVRGRSLTALKNGALKGAKLGPLIMAPLAPLMTEGVIRNATEEAIYDRSFRIRVNQGQLRADRWSTYAGILGGGAGLMSGAGLVTGAVGGIALGTVSAAVYTAKFADDKKVKSETKK